MKNSSFFELNNDSYTLIDLRAKNFDVLKEKLNDFDDIIPKDDEIGILDNYIIQLKNNLNLNNQLEELDILPEYLNAINDFIPGIQIKNEKYKIIDDIIKNTKKRESLTLKRICNKYKKITGIIISKAHVYNILKNKLNYKYLRTCPKTNKIKENTSIIRSFIFVKTVIKAISLKMKIIYLDESNFQLENNHLRVWRNKIEFPYFNTYKRGRKNIILAISDEDILLYQINNNTNKSSDFLAFMEKLVEKIKVENISNYLFIMDNCSIHLTKSLKKFYEEKKMKILTIVPYRSDFNGVEFVFNYIKQFLYKKIFRSFKKMINFVEDILTDENIGDILGKIFIKTMIIYKNFILNNKSIDLNKIE